jgi:mRNA-degrading endonuclease RelE of RelBE toxin-antitoxin system
MSFDLVATPRFKRDIKKLAKKYPSLKSEYSSLINGLAENPVQGIPLGNNCFKIPVAIA